MARLLDLTGRKFNKWTVISRAPNTPTGQAQWLCKCDCGKTRIVRGQSLRNGTSRACGCSFGTHKATNTRLYNVWRGMKQRCYKDEDGITIRYAEYFLEEAI